MIRNVKIERGMEREERKQHKYFLMIQYENAISYWLNKKSQSQQSCGGFN